MLATAWHSKMGKPLLQPCCPLDRANACNCVIFEKLNVLLICCTGTPCLCLVLFFGRPTAWWGTFCQSHCQCKHPSNTDCRATHIHKLTSICVWYVLQHQVAAKSEAYDVKHVSVGLQTSHVDVGAAGTSVCLLIHLITCRHKQAKQASLLVH